MISFERWAKELIFSEVKCDGASTYIKKEGCFWATPTGFLVHVYPDKISFGGFRICYEIMPMVAPLNEYMGRTVMAMGLSSLDIDSDYRFKFSIPIKDYASIDMCNEIHHPKTYVKFAKLIHEYLNPILARLGSLRDYCIEAITFWLGANYLKTDSMDIETRRSVALKIFDEENVDQWYAPPEEEIGIDPIVLHRSRINKPPYVYAALGKYEQALKIINDTRAVMLDGMEYTYKAGHWTREILEEQIAQVNSLYSDIEDALQNKDREACEAILDQHYKNNKTAVRDQLGLELPETWKTGDGSKPLKRW